MKYLLFQCYAPLVSWGTIAVGGERLTFRHPKKSSIIGLIAAALGIKREEEIKNLELVNSIGFATKVISSGVILNDFHTIQVPRINNSILFNTRKDELRYNKLKIRTILSNREYLCDALSVIAIWLKDNNFDIYKLKKSLKYPVFSLYIGRKACTPALPLNPKIIEKDTIKNAFDCYDVNFPLPIDRNSDDITKERITHFQKSILKEKITSYYWEKCDHSGIKATQKNVRYDVPISRIRWQFTHRYEYLATIEEVYDVSE
jgi:CRISPR system Cascade subunit CasD